MPAIIALCAIVMALASVAWTASTTRITATEVRGNVTVERIAVLEQARAGHDEQHGWEANTLHRLEKKIDWLVCREIEDAQCGPLP